MDIKYSFFGIISRSFKFFGKNFKELFGAMFMPVFLQGAGLLASLFPALYFTYIQKPTADMMMVFLLQLLLCLVFGLVLFCIGFWRYILLSCYFCLAANDFDDDKGFYIQIYKNNINKRQGEYIKTLLWPALIMLLIIVVGVIVVHYFIMQKTVMGSLLGVLSFLVATIVLVIFSIKINLLVPIFVFEPELKPIDVMKKSLNMVKLPQFFWLLAFSLVFWLISFAIQLIISIVASICTSDVVFLRIVDLISTCIAMFLLPINICIVTLFYKKLTK